MTYERMKMYICIFFNKWGILDYFVVSVFSFHLDWEPHLNLHICWLRCLSVWSAMMVLAHVYTVPLYNAANFHPNPHKRQPIAHPHGWVMGCFFVNITSDAYFASVIVVPYAKLCYVGPCDNGTRLCMCLPKESIHSYHSGYLTTFVLLIV